MAAVDIALIRVRTTSSPFKVAGAIAHTLREHGHTDVQSIGAAATSQSIKAIIYARRYLEQDHLDLTVIPELVTLTLKGKERSAVLLHLTACPTPSTQPDHSPPSP